MRTSLTMLGMIIGVAAVITMVGLGQGAQQEIAALDRGLPTQAALRMRVRSNVGSRLI